MSLWLYRLRLQAVSTVWWKVQATEVRMLSWVSHKQSHCITANSAAGESAGLHFFSAFGSTWFHMTELCLRITLHHSYIPRESLGFTNLFVKNLCRQRTNFCVRHGDYPALKQFRFRTVAWVHLGVGQVPVLDSARTDGICFTKGSWKWMSVLIEEIAFSEKFISPSNSKLGLLEVLNEDFCEVWLALFNTRSSCILTNL